VLSNLAACAFARARVDRSLRSFIPVAEERAAAAEPRAAILLNGFLARRIALTAAAAREAFFLLPRWCIAVCDYDEAIMINCDPLHRSWDGRALL